LRDVLHAGFALVDGGEETTPEKSVAELRATQLEKLGDTRVTANGTPAGNGQRPG
jgi:hypothetical protein